MQAPPPGTYADASLRRYRSTLSLSKGRSAWPQALACIPAIFVLSGFLQTQTPTPADLIVVNGAVYDGDDGELHQALARPGGSDQRLPLGAAIDGYTGTAAFASFADNERGTLAPGKLADVVVLATDVFARAPTARSDVAVAVTIFDGKVVFRSADR